MNKKKVAIIVGSLGRGGAERVTIYLSNYFKEKEIDSYIITALKRENEYDVPKGVSRINLQDFGLTSIFYLSKNLRKIIKEKKFDIVIIMDTPTCLYAIPGCVGTGAAIIVSERNAPTHFSGKKITKIISRFLMRLADDYVFQTEDAKKYYSKILKGKGTIIPNPIDSKSLPEIWNGDKKKEIVSVGRLDEQKNQKMMIKAFSRIANDFVDYKLIIYGEGSKRKELENLIEKFNLQNQVFLPGVMPNVLLKIKDAYMFVFSSDYEGMPNALIEALAMGLPCISTNCPCGGPASLIENEKNGLLIPVGDEKKFADAMKYLIIEKDVAKKIGLEAAKIRNYLSIERIGELWRLFALKVLKEKEGK